MMMLDNACAFCIRIRPILSAALTAMILLLSAYFFYSCYLWVNDNQPVLEFGIGRANKLSAAPGEDLIIFQPVKKLRDCDGQIRRYLTGQCGHHVLWAGSSSLKKGYAGELIYPIHIPIDALPGSCKFRVNARFACNPIDFFSERQVFESWPVDFTVRQEGTP